MARDLQGDRGLGQDVRVVERPGGRYGDGDQHHHGRDRPGDLERDIVGRRPGYGVSARPKPPDREQQQDAHETADGEIDDEQKVVEIVQLILNRRGRLREIELPGAGHALDGGAPIGARAARLGGIDDRDPRKAGRNRRDENSDRRKKQLPGRPMHRVLRSCKGETQGCVLRFPDGLCCDKKSAAKDPRRRVRRGTGAGHSRRYARCCCHNHCVTASRRR